ncbi:MAG: WD40 repeat domain-containing protein, partial [Chloroflexi bacterium]|nr:WD40 repeat domain-containing protein [Chloroflexota bacterium]
VGRTEEVALLRRWVLEERTRLVAVLGMGGIGKTSLAARLAQSVTPNFERVYWRSLRNAPPVSDWLAAVIGFLSDQQSVPPASESERIARLLELLRSRRCLLVLDNSETLFEPGVREVRYRAGMDGYGGVQQAIGETSHLSCLLLTSREAPPELAFVPGARALELHGLGVSEAQALLADKRMNGDAQSWTSLVDRYDGNGLALKIVGETIRQVYAGHVDEFLADALANSGAVFGGIRRLLDVQMERLSSVEYEVLRQLAVEREPISVTQLSREMEPATRRGVVIEAIEALRRRSLVERGDQGATFTLQSMVLEHVTEQLVETAADEITRGEPVLLVELPLIKAQAKDYVRQMQERLIGGPILQRMTSQYGDREAVQRLQELLNAYRRRTPAEQGYAPGNLVNLLRLLRGDLRGMDLSSLVIRHAYLAQVNAQDASLANAQLAECVLAEAFDLPNSVALSGDGDLLAAGTATGRVCLWRVADRTQLWAAHGHSAAVRVVALSADGRFMASGGGDATVRLWDTLTGRQLAILHGHIGPVPGVALSADGQLVVSGGFDGTVRLWEASTGRSLATLEGQTGEVLVAVSADGRLVASGDGAGTVRLWDARDGRSVATLNGHTRGIRGVALAADGRLMVSLGAEGAVRLWATDTGTRLAILPDQAGRVVGVALSADGARVATRSADGTVRLWEAETGRALATLQGNTRGLLGVALSADGQLMASRSADGTLGLWETGTGRSLATLQGLTGTLWSLALSGDGQLVVSGGLDGTVRLWDASTGRSLAALEGHTGDAVVALSSDGRLVASGGGEGTVRLWDAGDGRSLATLEGHTRAVLGVALSADGQLVASSGADGTLRLWHAITRRQLATLDGHTGPVVCVALSADGRLVVSGGADGTVRLWEAGTGRPVATMHDHAGRRGVLVAISADGRLVASGGADGTVRLWEAVSGRQLTSLHGYTGPVLAVALSADGRLAAMGGGDGTVRLWDTNTEQPVATLRGHTGTVRGVAISANGHLLASGSFDGTVMLWEPQSGTCQRTLRPDGLYERMDITGLTGVTPAQRGALLAVGAVQQHE